MTKDLLADAEDPDAAGASVPTATTTVEWMVFRLGSAWYAVAPQAVREVVASIAPTPIPGVPGVIRGAVSLAGRVVVVIDLARLLGAGTEDDFPASRMLVVSHQAAVFAAPVTEVIGVRDVARDAIAPCEGTETDPAVEKFVDRDRQITVLDVGRLLALATTQATGGSRWNS